MTKKIVSLALAAVLGLSLCASAGAEWQGDFYITPDGARAVGLRQIDGVRWQFSEDGTVVGKYSGWSQSKTTGKYYYYQDGERLSSGWLKRSWQYSYFLPGGELAVGTHTIGGHSFTFDEQGFWDFQLPDTLDLLGLHERLLAEYPEVYSGLTARSGVQIYTTDREAMTEAVTAIYGDLPIFTVYEATLTYLEGEKLWNAITQYDDPRLIGQLGSAAVVDGVVTCYGSHSLSINLMRKLAANGYDLADPENKFYRYLETLENHEHVYTYFGTSMYRWTGASSYSPVLDGLAYDAGSELVTGAYQNEKGVFTVQTTDPAASIERLRTALRWNAEDFTVSGNTVTLGGKYKYMETLAGYEAAEPPAAQFTESDYHWGAEYPRWSTGFDGIFYEEEAMDWEYDVWDDEEDEEPEYDSDWWAANYDRLPYYEVVVHFEQSGYSEAEAYGGYMALLSFLEENGVRYYCTNGFSGITAATYRPYYDFHIYSGYALAEGFVEENGLGDFIVLHEE